MKGLPIKPMLGFAGIVATITQDRIFERIGKEDMYLLEGAASLIGNVSTATDKISYGRGYYKS